MQSKMKDIVKHYGINSQQRKFAEEVFELQEAITQKESDEDGIVSRNYYKYKESITEEIADCIVMLSQFKEYYNITDEELNKQIEYKINRQIERIKERSK